MRMWQRAPTCGYMRMYPHTIYAATCPCHAHAKNLFDRAHQKFDQVNISKSNFFMGHPVFFHPAVAHCETHTRLYLFEALAEMWIEIGVKLGNINFHFSDVNCVVLRQKRFPYLRCCTIDRSCRQDTTTIRRPGSTNNRGKGAA